MAKVKGKTGHVITVSAELPMYDQRDRRTKDKKHLEMLNGFFDPDSMVPYLGSTNLINTLRGGYLRCKLDGQRLVAITDFGAPAKLTKLELNELKNECLGQWSDGIGEGAFADFSDTAGFGVDTLLRKVRVTQAIGVPFMPDAKARAKLTRLKTKWKQAAKANKPSHDMATLIKCFSAVKAKKLVTLKQLLKSGKVDVNATCRSKTSEFDEARLLVYAARHSNASTVSVLLDAGADPNQQDEFSYGYAPMHRACSPTIVQRLLAAGADPNICTRSFKETPLLQDEVVKHPECVKLLLAAKANPNARNEFGDETPLTVAAQVSAKSVELLLKAGAKATRAAIQNAVSPDSMHSRTTNADRLAIVQLLLKAGVKPDLELLLDAVGSENEPLVRALVKAKVPLNKQGKLDELTEIRPSPLTRAIVYHSTKMVNLLISLGADPNLGKGVDHPLHVAMAEGSLPHVKLLLSAGATPGPVIKGETLEQTAKKLGSPRIAAYVSKLEGASAKETKASVRTTEKTRTSKKSAAKPKISKGQPRRRR